MHETVCSESLMCYKHVVQTAFTEQKDFHLTDFAATQSVWSAVMRMPTMRLSICFSGRCIASRESNGYGSIQGNVDIPVSDDSLALPATSKGTEGTHGSARGICLCCSQIILCGK